MLDTGCDPERLAACETAHPGVDFVRGPNRGYAGGANRLLHEIGARVAEPDFVLLLNPDVVLEPAFAEILLAAVAARERVAIASGKLLRPDGSTLDSAGIRLPRHRRPRDRGSEEQDRGAYDRCETVFGVSGAAMLLRRSALAELALEGEVFDEDFFLYHEDTDLCWRAGLLGFEVLYVPSARAIHARGWRRAERARIAPSVRRHSFKNHYLQILKNERAGDLVRNLPVLLAWEILRLGFAILRDQEVLGAYRDALRAMPRAWRKRRALMARARRVGPACVPVESRRAQA